MKASRTLITFIATTVVAASAWGLGDSEPSAQTRSELLLGTAVNVTAYGPLDSGVMDEVFDRVLEIEALMSTSEDDYMGTELMKLNAAAGSGPIPVSEDTLDVVEIALGFSAASSGAFDISVQPLVKIWGIGTANPGIPESAVLEEALASVGYENIRLNRDAGTIELLSPGMGIDVGGIAKGYAADEAAALLRENGVESALLDFGGNILTIGTKPDGSPWRIGVQVPDASRGAFLGIAAVSDVSLVTSGTYERYFEVDGVRYHHILDTQTGYPVRNELESVTIITPQSIEADALSTLVFALGLEAGLEFAERREGVEAILVTEDKGVYTTSGVGAYFNLTNPEYELR